MRTIAHRRGLRRGLRRALRWRCYPLALAALFHAGAALAGSNSLTVINKCKFPVWIQQQNVTGAPAIKRITANGGRYTYDIPLSGPQSTRFWPKRGCDAQGNNCEVGQSSPPCPAKGCSPPVDSKIEVNWGCLDSSCGGKNNETFFNLSQVDGFTLPYSVRAVGEGNNCRNAACPTMDYATQCPVSDNLSTENHFPALKNEDLRMRDPATKKLIGCFSTCGKLTFAAAFGGHNFSPNDPRAAFYCCAKVNGTNPLPRLDPATPDGCRAGPVPATKYVKLIDSACKNSVYGYAYDDAHGTRNCIGPTQLTFTICP